MLTGFPELLSSDFINSSRIPINLQLLLTSRQKIITSINISNDAVLLSVCKENDKSNFLYSFFFWLFTVLNSNINKSLKALITNLFPGLRAQPRRGDNNILRTKGNGSLQGRSILWTLQGTCTYEVNLQQLWQHAQDPRMLKPETISAWRWEIGVKSHT